MNKKIFGLRVGTIISFFVCLAVAFLIWLYASYAATSEESAEAALKAVFTRC